MRSIRFLLTIAISILLLASLLAPAPTAGQGQDLTFRLMNVERRLDQMQVRVDYLERAQQSQPLNNQSSNMTTSAILDLQRQQTSLAEQVVTMQRQMLEMQKKIDQLTPPTHTGQEKKEKPEEKPKPKPTAKP
jgi:hypothetical protein